ncbi:MAG TPA: hypothetical protein PKL31_08705 [Fulvivirga sp.]|nr:hypothetical protein [Fulvivirga sp.]
MKKISIVVLFAFVSTGLLGQVDSLQYYYQAAMDANKAQDYETFTKSLVRANDLRPNHPTILRHLINGALLTGNKDLAINTLNNMVLMNAELDLADSAYTMLHTDPRFTQLTGVAKKLNQPIEQCEIGLETELGSLHPETIAYHDTSKSFYFGGVHNREIVKVSPDGSITSILDYKKLPSLMAVMGIEIDHQNNILWACTTALPQIKDYSDSLAGTSTVIAFDLNIGEVVENISISDGNTFGDLILDSKGKVYLSDGQSNKVFTVSNGKLKPYIDLTKEILNLQGLAFNGDESLLYVSDYISGIYRVDLATMKVDKVQFPKDIPTKGIDGVYWYDGNLIALQNGTNPKRVLQFELETDGKSIKGSKIIAQALEVLNEPTQGLILNKEFWFIANSPWAAYNKNNEFLMEEASPTVLMKYAIKK